MVGLLAVEVLEDAESVLAQRHVREGDTVLRVDARHQRLHLLGLELERRRLERRLERAGWNAPAGTATEIDLRYNPGSAATVQEAAEQRCTVGVNSTRWVKPTRACSVVTVFNALRNTSFSVVYLAHISLILYHYGLQVLTGGFRGLSQ